MTQKTQQRDEPTKEYHGTGFETAGPGSVTVVDGDESYELDPRNDLQNHSTDGFQAGYQGSGPAQLALALIADACGEIAVFERTRDGDQMYQSFKRDVVARLDSNEFAMTEAFIREYVSFNRRRDGAD